MILAANMYTDLRGIPLVFSFLVALFCCAVIIGIFLTTQREINQEIVTKAKHDKDVAAARGKLLKEKKLGNARLVKLEARDEKDLSKDEKDELKKLRAAHDDLEKLSKEKISVRSKEIENITMRGILKGSIVAVVGFIIVTIIAGVSYIVSGG